MKPQGGFTLLEVTVALSIAALMAVMVTQLLRQRVAMHEAVQGQQLGSLCARELQARFSVERYWPLQSQASGQLQQGGATCFWQLQLGNTGVRNLRRGELTLFGDPQARQPIGHYSLFLVRP